MGASCSYSIGRVSLEGLVLGGRVSPRLTVGRVPVNRRLFQPWTIPTDQQAPKEPWLWQDEGSRGGAWGSEPALTLATPAAPAGPPGPGFDWKWASSGFAA